MDQIVRLGFGSANYPKHSITFAALKVEPPFKKVTAVNSGRQVTGSKVWVPAGRFPHNKGISQQQVEHPNGTIILMQSNRSQNGLPFASAGLFLRLRHGAPLYNVYGKIPVCSNNICGDRILVFSGNADLLTVPELKVAGLEVNRGYIGGYMDPEELGDCFQVQKVAEETVARPTLQAIATDRGVELREVPNAPMRRMRFRK